MSDRERIQNKSHTVGSADGKKKKHKRREWVKKGEDDTVTRTPKKVYDSIVSHTFKVGFIGLG